MFEMSYNDAIRIQRSQMVWYRRMIGLRGTRNIRRMTKPCPPDIHPDMPISIFLINKLVPRGSNFESQFWCKYHRKKGTEQTAFDQEVEMAWSDGIKKGLL
jgi:hypothetical protein